MSADCAHPLAYFDGIYVINLKSRSDRRREVKAELARVGVPESGYVFFDAVRPLAAEPFPSIGAKGCFMSHLGVLYAGAKVGHQRLLILEDDVEFVAQFNERMRNIISELQTTQWDVFYGGGGVEDRKYRSRELATIEPQTGVMCTHFIAFNGLDVVTAVHDYLSAQLKRPPGDPAGGPMHVDGSYSWARRELALTTLIAQPEVCYQRPSASDIVNGGWKSAPLIQYVLRIGRSMQRARRLAHKGA